MRAGEHGALADELEIAPGQQRIAGHPVLGDKKGVAGELRLEALVYGIAAHALGARLPDVVAGQLVLVVGPDLKDTGAAYVFRSQHAAAHDSQLRSEERRVGKECRSRGS